LPTAPQERIAIFASGSGSNAVQIIRYFRDHPTIRVELVVSNRPAAPVLEKARQLGVDTLLVTRPSFYETETLLDELKARQITFLVLAGFLWLVPPYLVRAYPRRIVNIHPALLPRYGGKGMYGIHVHRAVQAAGDRVSGMTIHYVNEQYDEGNIIFQADCPLDPADTPEEIAAKVLRLEHAHYAPVIENLLTHRRESGSTGSS
jgi:phosphoribosylglycinamide formyltransferase-1